MLKKLDSEIGVLSSRAAIVTCAGFEERAPVAMRRAVGFEVKFSKAIVALYPEAEHESAEREFDVLASQLVQNQERRIKLKLNSSENDSFEQALTAALSDVDHVFCDITGFNTHFMFSALTAILKSRKPFSILYTEADEYRPTKEEYDHYFSSDFADGDISDIEDYEESASIYSKVFDVEFIANFEGDVSPGYPYYLIAFLPFKRSRLGAILQELSVSKQILIAGEPERPDIVWRLEALKKINKDIILDKSSKVVDSPTICLEATLSILDEIINSDHNKYRYNFVVAPLGGKIQKLGCWIFAVLNPRLSVISSTPNKMYINSYSKGYRDTFVLMDINAYFP